MVARLESSLTSQKMCPGGCHMEFDHFSFGDNQCRLISWKGNRKRKHNAVPMCFCANLFAAKAKPMKLLQREESMSEKKRQKKDGQRKDKKNQAMRESVEERKENAPNTQPNNNPGKAGPHPGGGS